MLHPICPDLSKSNAVTESISVAYPRIPKAVNVSPEHGWCSRTSSPNSRSWRSSYNDKRHKLQHLRGFTPHIRCSAMTSGSLIQPRMWNYIFWIGTTAGRRCTGMESNPHVHNSSRNRARERKRERKRGEVPEGALFSLVGIVYSTPSRASASYRRRGGGAVVPREGLRVGQARPMRPKP
jgi:hypothetical protein